jgi:hypothetical protein
VPWGPVQFDKWIQENKKRQKKRKKREISRFEKLFCWRLLYLKLGNLQRGQDETTNF